MMRTSLACGIGGLMTAEVETVACLTMMDGRLYDGLRKEKVSSEVFW